MATPQLVVTSEVTVMDTINEINSDSTRDEPFFVCDLGDVIGKFHLWKQKLPRIRPFYAVKANSEPTLIKLLQGLGAGFDCASKGEIEMVMSCGGTSKDIVFAHPQKFISHLVFASKKGVDLMTFDSENELHKIKKYFPSARLLLRFRIPNVEAKFQLSEKFGCDQGESVELLKIARKLELNVVGVAYHVGSMCTEASAFRKAMRIARDIFDAANHLGFRFNVLDIGGGFPGHLGTYELFDEMSKEIREGLDESFPQTDETLQVIAEPGNYFVNSAWTLCVTVIGRKLAPQSSDGCSDGKSEIMYYLNDGRYGTLPWYWRDYGADMQIISREGRLKTGHESPSKVWGCSCCCTDSVLSTCSLPEMDVGDHMVIRNMGAYMSSVSSNFNGFSLTPTYYICTDRPQCDDDYRNFLESGLTGADIYSSIFEPGFQSEYLKRSKCRKFVDDLEEKQNKCPNGQPV